MAEGERQRAIRAVGFPESPCRRLGDLLFRRPDATATQRVGGVDLKTQRYHSFGHVRTPCRVPVPLAEREFCAPTWPVEHQSAHLDRRPLLSETATWSS